MSRCVRRMHRTRRAVWLGGANRWAEVVDYPYDQGASTISDLAQADDGTIDVRNPGTSGSSAGVGVIVPTDPSIASEESEAGAIVNQQASTTPAPSPRPSTSASTGAPQAVPATYSFVSADGIVECGFYNQITNGQVTSAVGVTCASPATSQLPPSPGQGDQGPGGLQLTPSGGVTVVSVGGALVGTVASAPHLGFGSGVRSGAITCTALDADTVRCSLGSTAFTLSKKQANY